MVTAELPSKERYSVQIILAGVPLPGHNSIIRPYFHKYPLDEPWQTPYCELYFSAIYTENSSEIL